MEFLDSLDLDTIHKKSHRVRSWYLYEQFKSLERSQLDAAQKLKDRSYQERILRQELSERRARRKLYDQFGLCQSESRLKSDESKINYKSTASTSDDDFFESLYLMHEEERVTPATGGNEFSGDGKGDTFSSSGLSVSQCCIPNYVNVEEHKDENGSYAGSVNSVVEKVKPPDDEFLPPTEMGFTLNSMEDDIKDSIAEDINMQLDSVKEDIECLEKIAKLEDVDSSELDKMSDSLNIASLQEVNHVKVSKKADQECNVFAVWSRLVSFAYQVVQLNHGECLEHLTNVWSRYPLADIAMHDPFVAGNCYCDYSSQFLTAVLMCDVLRRGVNRMCHILQPYVSPIEFANDESLVSDTGPNLYDKQKKLVQFKKCKKICEIKPLSRKKAKKFIKTRRSAERKYSGRYCTQNDWKPFYTKSLDSGTDTIPSHRRAIEPRRRSAKIFHYREAISPRSSSSGTIWSDLLREKPMVSGRQRYCYTYQNRALHPMLKIAHCIDSILKDIDDTKQDM